MSQSIRYIRVLQYCHVSEASQCQVGYCPDLHVSRGHYSSIPSFSPWGICGYAPGRETLEVFAPIHRVNGLGIPNLECPMHMYRSYHFSELEIYCKTMTETPIISTSVIQDTYTE